MARSEQTEHDREALVRFMEAAKALRPILLRRRWPHVDGALYHVLALIDGEAVAAKHRGYPTWAFPKPKNIVVE